MPITIPLPPAKSKRAELLDQEDTSPSDLHCAFDPIVHPEINVLGLELDYSGFDPDLDDVWLPSSLERRSDGGIGITGHRIKLPAVLQVLRSSNSVSIMHLSHAFPTVPIEKLAEIVRFCTAHKAVVDRYYDKQNQIAQENERRYGCSPPSLNELRAEWKAILSSNR